VVPEEGLQPGDHFCIGVYNHMNYARISEGFESQDRGVRGGDRFRIQLPILLLEGLRQGEVCKYQNHLRKKLDLLTVVVVPPRGGKRLGVFTGH